MGADKKVLNVLKRRMGVLETVDIGRYMNLWRFKRIKLYLSRVMRDKLKMVS